MDTDLQRILWRSNPAAEIQDFRLTTVTYGTALAPYLAIRTLLQLAQDEGARFPHGADALRLNTYVDDILAGASSLEAALDVRRQFVELLSVEGFQLSKWAGTHAALCPDGDGLDRLFSGVGSVGTLGVLWSPTTDTLHLRAVPDLASLQTCTKRSVLLEVARFFDPVGWAAPVLITAKIFLQDLWTAGLDWDEQQDIAGEIEAFSPGCPLPRRSALLALRPILRQDGLLRVGGRLQHAPLPFGERHPIILARTSHLALLLVRDAHYQTLHGRPQLTRSVLARRYWIIHANSLVQSEVHRCVRCVRFRGATARQQMGQLPVDRVRACRPFRSAGVDYAGPIQWRFSKGRGCKTTKGYIYAFSFAWPLEPCTLKLSQI